jgi:hypothetical protein
MTAVPHQENNNNKNSTGAMKGLSSLSLVSEDLPQVLDNISISDGVASKASIIIGPQFKAMLC